ncbi:hypothetical protein [Saccharolobus caldissimus]|uniref:Uncharacterized protein n=1 Tax=Saccharolobus caldissimus TaxID=1702097 RepID=A0AAQ4CQ49_9CREN|nr:hypothetical protein [Saccharolobus caldissimus]BDB97930.1 hypothetical protein SACC_09470 [Saccharolobus caldissimus]
MIKLRDENMARRHKHSILIYGARETARKTVDNLKDKYEKAQMDPNVKREWLNNYFEKIGGYIESPERRKEAEEKLETWYGVLVTNVAPEFAKAMQKAKSEYYRKLAEKIGEMAEERNTEGYRYTM